MPAQPAVVVVSGHMVDRPDRATPRFPSDQVERVTAEIGAALERWDVGPQTLLIAGGARGADIIAAERARELGARIRLVLAHPPATFERESVALEGSDWAARFRALLDVADVDVVEHADGEDVYARTNARIVRAARAIDPQPFALIVWDGGRGDGPGGTRDLVERLGHSEPGERICVVDPTRRRYEPRQRRTGEPKRILALDGGGIRGALSIEILAALESRLRARCGPDLVLAEYFDYIGGTSTGAIIATALAMGKPVAEIRDKYEQLGPKIFRKRLLPLRLRSMYRDGPLTRELEAFFGAGSTLGDPRLRTLLLLVMHNAVTDSPWPLSNCTQAKYNRADRNLLAASDRNLDLPLTTLVRGSTAAPMYFSAQQLDVGEKRFVFQDGGVTPFNNPALLMFLMATLPEYRVEWDTGEEQLLVVSVGSGSSDAVHPGLSTRKTLWFQARNLPGVFMNGASFGEDLMSRSLARTRAGASLDREIGDRIGRPGVGNRSLFTYLRYDADLSEASLEAAGISTAARRKRVRKLDSVSAVEDLQELGAKVGATIDLDVHFAGFLPPARS